jgi:folylpolyglutamate synthase
MLLTSSSPTTIITSKHYFKQLIIHSKYFYPSLIITYKKMSSNTTDSSSNNKRIQLIETNNHHVDTKTKVSNILQLTMEAARREIISNEKRTVSTQESIRNQLRERATLLGINNLDDDLPPIVHVAGTKGKGSTCAMVESILRSANLKTGLFTSPHLINPRERIRINGKLISPESFQHHVIQTFNALTMNGTDLSQLPGFFPFMTLCAFRTFAKTTIAFREIVDVLILETGIGGRLDATNVIDKPLCTAVTKLDLDHTQLLGNTIEQIAYEKACISKRGVRCFTPLSQVPEALDVIKKKCIENGALLTICSPLTSQEISNGIGLDGEHQLENAAIAKALSEVVLDAFHITDIAKRSLAINTGLQQVSWPGRSQIIEKGKIRYYFDGAHTPISVEAAYKWFISAMMKFNSQQQQHLQHNKLSFLRILIFHCSEDRDGILMLTKLNRNEFDLAYFCPPESGPPPSSSSSSTTPQQVNDNITSSTFSWHEKLANSWNDNNNNTNNPGIALKNFNDLLTTLKTIQNQNENVEMHIFVVGSFYLVGDLLKYLNYDMDND